MKVLAGSSITCFASPLPFEDLGLLPTGHKMIVRVRVEQVVQPIDEKGPKAEGQEVSQDA